MSTTMVQDDGRPLTRLRWQWLLVAAFYAAGLLAGYRFLVQAWEAARAAQWLALAGATMALQLAILWWALPQNRRQADGEVFSFLGYANCLTLLRGLLICMVAGFLFAPPPDGALAWIPAVLYLIERGIDLADGYVARATHRQTKLGAILDMEFDGLGVLAVVTLAVQYGKLPLWYLLLGVARPLFVFGMWLRRRRGLPVYDLPPSDHRRVIAGIQFTFLCLVLWPALSPQITLLAAYLFAIPLALSFARDWLVVSGVVDPASAPYRRARHTTKRLVEGWLPLGARLVAVLITALILGRELPGFPQWGTLLGQTRENGGTTPLLGIAVAGAVAAVLLLPGIAGRVAAALLFGLACVDILAAGLGWPGNALLLACAAIVLHLGSGRFSLWKPEERFLRPRPGGSRPTDS